MASDPNDPLGIRKIPERLASRLGIVEPYRHNDVLLNSEQAKLQKELVQTSRAIHVANTVKDTTEAVIRATNVFADPNSSPRAKAAAVMKCVATLGQIAALLGPAGLILNSVLNMVSGILDKNDEQAESMVDQLEKMMRKLMGESVANDINSSDRMIKRQIAGLQAFDDGSQSWRDILQIAPLTSGISQFKILAASEWLYRSENQDLPIWEEVFTCHAQAMTTVYRLLTAVRLKINPQDPGFKSFENVAESIYADFWNQCAQFGKRITLIGHTRYIGTNQPYVWINDGDVNKGARNTDWGKYTSIALAKPTSNRVEGWGAYTDHRIGHGTLDNDMTINTQPLGCRDLGVDFLNCTGDTAYFLLITTNGPSFNQPGRLIIHEIKKQPMDGKLEDAAKIIFQDWSKGFGYHNLLMARSFTAALKQGEPAFPVSAKLVYLLAKKDNGFTYLSYAEWDNERPGKLRATRATQELAVEGERIAVSNKLMFYLPQTYGTIEYMTHDDFVDTSQPDYTKKPHGSMPVINAKSNRVVDMFACSDERLLVVMRSGSIWNVRLKDKAQARNIVRNFSDDEWEWSQISGQTAVSVGWMESDIVATWQTLREMCKVPPVWKKAGADIP